MWGLPEGVEKAKAAALKAIELDPSLAGGYNALAIFKTFADWDWSGAEQAVKRAIELNPSGGRGRLAYGWILLFTGRLDEAIDYMRIYRERDPLSAVGAETLASALLRRGDHEEAIVEAEKAIELAPALGLGYMTIGTSYCVRGMVGQAMATLERARTATGDNPGVIAVLAWCHAISGNREEARALLGELEARAEQVPVAPQLFAQVHVGLGEADEAFEWLERGYALRWPTLPWSLQAGLWDPLYDDPRFDDLLARIGVPRGPHGLASRTPGTS